MWFLVWLLSFEEAVCVRHSTTTGATGAKGRTTTTTTTTTSSNAQTLLAACFVLLLLPFCSSVCGGSCGVWVCTQQVSESLRDIKKKLESADFVFAACCSKNPAGELRVRACSRGVTQLFTKCQQGDERGSDCEYDEDVVLMLPLVQHSSLASALISPVVSAKYQFLEQESPQH